LEAAQAAEKLRRAEKVTEEIQKVAPRVKDAIAKAERALAANADEAAEGTAEKLAKEVVRDAQKGVPFRPSKPVRISDAHSANSINAKTRWGAGNRNSPKTVARGDVDLAGDVAEINAGRATRLPNGDIRAPSGRVYGTHPGQPGIFPRGGPGTVTLSQAEFSVYKQMVESGGLVSNARRAFDGMMRDGNKGLSAASEQKLIDLFRSRVP
jgi:hypothetical protein